MPDIAAFCWDLSAALDVENIELPKAKIEGLAQRLIEVGYGKNTPESPDVWTTTIPAGVTSDIIKGVPLNKQIIVELYDSVTGEMSLSPPDWHRRNGGDIGVKIAAHHNPVLVRVLAF